MKKNIPTILTGICCVLLGITLVQNYELKRQISEMESNLWNQVSRLETSVNTITWNIDQKMEEEASILSDSSWSYGDADMDAKTVTVICRVTPKEYVPELTKAYISCENELYPMVLEDGTFVAEIPMNLFEDSCVEHVRFEENGTIRVEKLDWNLYPRQEYLPTAYVDFAGGTSGSKKDGTFVRTFDSEALIQLDYKDDLKPEKSIEMVEMLDGKELRRTEIPVGTYRYEMDHTVTIPFGSSYGIYFEVTDLYDLHHRCWLWYETVDEKGNSEGDPFDMVWPGAEASIYGADGEPLIVFDEELYQ